MAGKHRSTPSSGTWLNTYADMVTLLLTFFAVLISMSAVNQDKFNAFIRSFSSLPPEVIEEIINGGPDDEGIKDGEIGEEEVTAMQELYKYIKAYVEENDAEGLVEMSSTDDVVYIRFNSSLLFYPDSYQLTPESYPTLSFIGNAITEFEDKIRTVNITGHTADPENGELRSSGWMLSGERASTVASYFEYDKGFDPTKLVILGYGKHYPVADNTDYEAKKLNRRVELIIVGNNSSANFDIYDSLAQVYAEAGVHEDTAGMDLFDTDGDGTGYKLPEADKLVDETAPDGTESTVPTS